MRLPIAAATLLLLGGCAATARLPETPAANAAAFTYIPLDPLPVEPVACAAGTVPPANPLDAFPDNAVRVAIRNLSVRADATLGPVAIGTSGNRYQVVLDYINVDTANIRFAIGARQAAGDNLVPIGSATLAPGTELTVDRLADGQSSPVETVIPVYVGVGLRLTATVEVIKGSVNLSSLGALAASAEAGQTAGSLVVQTLGINGKQIAASLPLPSELSAIPVQNAIQSLGAIKAGCYFGYQFRCHNRLFALE